jgi:hypothetical protein
MPARDSKNADSSSSDARARSLLARWYPAIVFVVAVAILMPKALAGQATYLAVDMAEPTSPNREALDRPPDVVSPVQTDQQEGPPLVMSFVDSLVDGDLRLWDPRVAAGTPTLTAFPFLASPLNISYAVLPDDYATTLVAALTLLIGQVFMFLLLRRLGVGPAAATFGALAYAFSGTEMAFLQRHMTAVWLLPGLLWAIHRALDRPALGRVLVVGLIIAWTWLEGFPSVFAYCMYTGVVWTAWLGYRRWRRAERAPEWRPAARDAAVRVAKVAGGFAWGAALAAVTLIPFLTEITERGVLDLRSTDLNSHLPSEYVWSLFDLSVNGDPLNPNDWWAGVNPFETVTVIGSIVLVAALIGLVPGIARRVRLSSEGRDAWPFFAFIAPAMTFVIFIGTHALGALYLVPGIANNPISRARFLIALGLCVLAALHLDSALSRDREREARVPARVALAALAFWIVIAALTFGDVLDAFDDADRMDELVEGLSVGVLLASGAAAVVLLFRARRLPAGVVAVVLAALVFAQTAWPLRSFTPQSPLEDFYPRTEGQAALETLSADRYRFAATNFNYYPNSAQLTDLYDLRGLALYDDPLRALLESATPTTFARDPLKQVLARDEWRLGAPAYDHLALRYFALSTLEEPYGERVVLDEGWDRWVEAPVELGVEVPGDRELAGLAVPLAGRGDCDSAQVSFELYRGDVQVDAAARPAYDAGGGWISMALAGRDADPGELRVVIGTDDESCNLLVGADERGDVASWLYLDDPSDSVRLAATEQSWIYERPTAWPLVSAHGAWRWFDDQASALAALERQKHSERDVAYLVGEGEDADGRRPAEVRDVTIGDDSVEAGVRADEPTLLVLAQDDSPGWSATVDGEDAPIESVDGALMGVLVKPGEHEVRFEYFPPRLLASAAISLVAAIGGIAAVAIRRRRGRDPA